MVLTSWLLARLELTLASLITLFHRNNPKNQPGASGIATGLTTSLKQMNHAQNPPKAQGYRPPPPAVEHAKAGHWYQYINRYWQCYLNGSELKLLLVIVNEQLGWEKNKAKPKWISRRNFATGVREKNGTIWHEGTGLADSTVDSGLASLETRGAIIVKRESHRDQMRCYYSINPSWRPWEAEKATKTAPRKSGKAPRNSGNPQPEIRGQRESKRKIISNPDSQPLPETGGGENRESEEAEKQSPNDQTIPPYSREVDYTDISDPDPYAEKLERIWRTALSEVFPNETHLAWVGRDRGSILGFCARYRAGNPKMPFGAFVDWAVRNWQYVMITEFGGRLRRKSDTPRVGLFVYDGERFIHALDHFDDWKKEMAMSPRDRAIKRLTDAGAPLDIAEQEADRELGITEQTQKLQRATLKLKKAAVSFERERQLQNFYEANRHRQPVQHVAPKKTPILNAEQIKAAFDDVPETFAPFSAPDEQ